jgi:RNA polymerase sigma-70 factor (ECF subfamily)
VFGDLTVDQVAAVLGRSRGAVKALQRRGYATIARLLEREGVPL